MNRNIHFSNVLRQPNRAPVQVQKPFNQKPFFPNQAKFMTSSTYSQPQVVAPHSNISIQPGFNPNAAVPIAGATVPKQKIGVKGFALILS